MSRYTPRVQELILDDEISLKVLQSLWFRTTLLLPNLKRLDWIYVGYTEITLIRLLLSPSLVHLYAWLNNGDHPSIIGFLECYHILCPNLESLHFSHLGCFPHVTTTVSRAISRSPHLKTLLCTSIDETALMCLASSRHLETLQAGLEDHQPDDLRRLAAYYGNPGHPPFENLRTIKLHFRDLSSIIPCLRSHSQPFECISFDLDMAATHEVLCEFFIALGSATRRRTLQRIHLSMEASEEQPMPLQAVDFQVLSLLMNFNLHEFDVDLLNPITLTDDELAHLIQAWPDLEMFYLNKFGWGYHSTSDIPTLKGLLLVIERCPKLCDLGICVDARRVPSLSGAESSICNRAIRTLLLADSPIQQSVVERVAQFLLHHFPLLGQIHQMSDNRAMWNSVGAMLGNRRGERSRVKP